MTLIRLVVLASALGACGGGSPAGSPEPTEEPRATASRSAAPPAAPAEHTSDAPTDAELLESLDAAVVAASLAHLRAVPPATLDAACSPPGIVPLSGWLAAHPADGVGYEASCRQGRCALVFTSIGVRTAVQLEVFYRSVSGAATELRCSVRRAG